ncbi:hypothetical protein B0H14DRAFT_2646869 [Mycena olivaceomarginata]|nr:hypothetical protein B0H14DRAFT_2646869 [Mycena olivaceomarginata]
MTQEWTQALTVWHKAASMGPKPKDPEAEKRKPVRIKRHGPQRPDPDQKEKSNQLFGKSAEQTSYWPCYGDPEFAEESVFRPERHYANADKPDCMMICTPPKGGGERRTTMFRNTAVYPVYMTIASHVCQLLITVAWIMADLADIGFLDTHPNGALTAAHWQEGRDLFIPVQTVANEPWHSMPSFRSKSSLAILTSVPTRKIVKSRFWMEDRIIALEEQVVGFGRIFFCAYYGFAKRSQGVDVLCLRNFIFDLRDCNSMASAHAVAEVCNKKWRGQVVFGCDDVDPKTLERELSSSAGDGATMLELLWLEVQGLHKIPLNLSEDGFPGDNGEPVTL